MTSTSSRGRVSPRPSIAMAVALASLVLAPRISGPVGAADSPTPAKADATVADPVAGRVADPVAGRMTFNGTCSHCHGPEAIVSERRLNLRQLQHKYTDQTETVFFATVTAGRPSKGMPAWKDVFTHQDFVNIYAYLNTLQEP